MTVCSQVVHGAKFKPMILLGIYVIVLSINIMESIKKRIVLNLFSQQYSCKKMNDPEKKKIECNVQVAESDKNNDTIGSMVYSYLICNMP